jgi:Protein kinase domain/WD domain, G-beta repeat
MKRVVAVKLIRRELVNDPDVVGRFYREMKVISRLEHPNVIHAYDAGPIGQTHFMAMEFIEGTDLSRLVKQSGCLPVAQACEYVRQTALGLQHAHERGLVHRDIKPHNVILSVRQGLIKVADLGLARLQTAANLEATAALTEVKGTGTLTPENAVMMGTADYLAPEQALDFHRADIRADIYSLGCTFYYLLTGQPPFPGATLAEKLLRHQQAEPPPLEQFRLDLPTGLSEVLGKMLAKRPEKRYQTPAALADALAGLVPRQGQTLPAPHAGGFAGKRRGRRAVLAVLGLASLGLGGLWLFRRKHFELEKIRERLKDPGTSMEEAWELVQDFRSRYPAAPEADQAAEMLRLYLLQVPLRSPGTAALQAASRLKQLPSPADQLDASRIDAAHRVAGQRKELVAVLGVPGPKPVLSVAWSPDGTLLASAVDTKVHLWEVVSGKKRPPLERRNTPIRRLLFHPAGQRLASLHSDGLVLWDVATGGRDRELETALKISMGSHDTLAFSPDGRWLAWHHDPKMVQLLDMMHDKEPRLIKGLGYEVSAIAFAPDGQSVTVGSLDPVVKIFEVSTSKELNAIPLDKYVPNLSLIYTSDGRALIRRIRDDVTVWDLAAKRVRTGVQPGHSESRTMALSPDGSLLAIERRDRLMLWDPAAGTAIGDWPKLPYTFRDVAFASDSRHLATANDNGTVSIFRLAGVPRP